MDILFVDDSKEPWYYGLEEDTPVARTGERALEIIKSRSINKPLDELWLDHDLGDGMDGYQLLKKVVEGGMAPKKVVCISWNAVGIERIENYCYDNDIPYERHASNLQSL